MNYCLLTEFAFSSPSRYNVRRCPFPRFVSFTDTNGIRHAVEVAASTLYGVATLAMAEFRRCGFTEDAWIGNAAHRDSEIARHIARGPMGQGRGVAPERGEAE